MIIRIRVTQYQIEHGLPHSATRCALALALTEALREPIVVSRTWFSSLRSENILWNGMPLSKRAQKFRKDYDAGRPVKPFWFRVNIPEVTR